MSNEEFAEHLGLAPRTVAGWHQNPSARQHPDAQRMLDAALQRAEDGARQRFAHAMRADDPERSGDGSQRLTVALSVVQRADSVLLVQRRDDGALRWQFPAGIVKPGASPVDAAVRETYVETGVHCSVREQIGARVHPQTGVYCEYFHCGYLAGEAENRDVVENASIAWVAVADLGRFIPESAIYPPILEVLGGTHV